MYVFIAFFYQRVNVMQTNCLKLKTLKVLFSGVSILLL